MSPLFEDSYREARISLSTTQIKGKEAEVAVEEYLTKRGIPFKQHVKERYINIDGADIQVDFIINNINGFKTHISVTHSNPVIPGHSNENKLHQKLSELYLFKTHDPETRIILVVGGQTSKWSPYVLKVFEKFFDYVVYVESPKFASNMGNALSSALGNVDFWNSESNLLSKIKLVKSGFNISQRNLREEFYTNVIRKLSEKTPPQYPNQISNLILRKMSESGKKCVFWDYLSKGKYEKIWQERNYFNPLEAITEIILENNDIWFKGGLGTSASVHHSVLHDLGYYSTRFTEDFLLNSRRYKKRVYIQCKSSAGGPNNTSKALPSRAREQIGRSLLYRTTIGNGSALISNAKDYLMIYILDGYWNSPRKYPLKYIHILQMAGADYIINGYDLIDIAYNVKEGNQLEQIVKNLQCSKNPIKLI